MREKLKRRLLFFTFLVFCSCVVIAQQRTVDSIYRVLRASTNDTAKVKALILLSNNFRIAGLYDSGLNYAEKAVTLAQAINSAKDQASALRIIGVINRQQGKYPQALENDFKALELYQKVGDNKGVATLLGNIGLVYWNQHNLGKSLNYDFRALGMCKSLKDSAGIARNLTNIGIVYYERFDFLQALEFDSSAMVIDKKLGDSVGIAANMGNMANIYEQMENYSKALHYDFMALEMCRKSKDQGGVCRNLGNIGTIYNLSRNYRMARIYLDSALLCAKVGGDKECTKDSYYWRAALDTNTNDYLQAYEDYKKYILYRDSLINEANTKKSIETEMNFEFEQKQVAEKAAQDKKDALTAAEKHRQYIITISVSIGLVLVLAFSGLLFSRYKLTQKQKQVIEEQKTLVEEKNKEILDSITYAKRLQDAILPPLATIQKYLPESFLLFKPKAIVAGDFYWMEKAGSTILLAAADCTGHGVPGAMVSVVCSNALNRTVKEFHITQPGKILDKVRELVLETFEKSENDVKDGMDISLLSISPDEGKIKIQWSGAYNSLWYVENGQLCEITGDKQPIGKYDMPKPFTTHAITLSPKSELRNNSGTTFYLFTDGYADQFGGPKGKKFKYQQMQQLILDNAGLTMEEQSKKLDQKLEEWKGSLEQVDDILIIGIRI